MRKSTFWTERRLTGTTLILGAVLFAHAAVSASNEKSPRGRAKR